MIITTHSQGWKADITIQSRPHEAWAYGTATGPDLLETVAAAELDLVRNLSALRALPRYVPPPTLTPAQNLLAILGLDQPPATPAQTLRRI